MRLLTIATTAFALVAFACGGDTAATPPASPPAAADSGVSPGVDAGPPVDAADPFAEIDAQIEAARVAQPGSPGVAIAIYDANDARVHVKSFGDFAPDRRVAIASSSKMVSATVLFALVGQNVLSLDSTTADVLGWTAEKGTITLRHLLSFTSGLAPENLCTFQASITLAACVDTIAAAPLDAPPATRFDYGSTHLQVAARMAEVLTGKTWNQLFRETVADPLGLPPEVAYFTGPKQVSGTTNPLIAGGMRASMDEYAKILGVVFHSGVTANRTFAPAELFEAQAKEPFPNVVVGKSPAKEYSLRYGLGAWLECAAPAAGCAKISSPGAFGFTPWLDRSARYYAILGMELNRTDDGVVNFAVDVERAIQPLIEQVLARR